jgi:hypothetical protein
MEGEREAGLWAADPRRIKKKTHRLRRGRHQLGQGGSGHLVSGGQPFKGQCIVFSHSLVWCRAGRCDLHGCVLFGSETDEWTRRVR